jgi:hypothetical protein
MSPVIQNNEQPNKEEIEALEKNVAEDILNNFDLPTSIQTAVDKAKAEEEKPTVEEESEEEETEEVELPKSLNSKEEEKEEVKEEEKDEEDEELIPKSKFQKRLDEMTREKRLLEMRLKALEEKAVQAQPQDEDLVKLGKMSESELQNLKRQTRLAQLKNASDDNMVSKLMELEDKIDATIRSVPQRFAANQVQQFNEAVAMTSQEIPEFNKVSKDVFALAKQIYDTAPELHKSESGQARAWNLAVQHYKIMQEANVGKSKVAELDRQVNTLKKKVSVDGVSRKASQEPDSSAKLFKKAKGGELRDKLEFFKKTLNTDSQVDGFLERNVL